MCVKRGRQQSFGALCEGVYQQSPEFCVKTGHQQSPEFCVKRARQQAPRALCEEGTSIVP